MNPRIHFPAISDAQWSFGSRGPSFYTKHLKYATGFSVDPFPCYTHDRKLVEDEVTFIEAKIPLKCLPNYYVLPMEFDCRTNGQAADSSDYEDQVKTLKPSIALSGKRIKIHPAMTRYLVSHEYGHVVHYNINHVLGYEHGKFDAAYAEFRGIPNNHEYGALKWHLNVGEVIANDIRVAVLGREIEFWQHDCPRPDGKITDYWNDILEKIK